MAPEIVIPTEKQWNGVLMERMHSFQNAHTVGAALLMSLVWNQGFMSESHRKLYNVHPMTTKSLFSTWTRGECTHAFLSDWFIILWQRHGLEFKAIKYEGRGFWRSREENWEATPSKYSPNLTFNFNVSHLLCPCPYDDLD
jgi:hypothetical protein